MVPPGERGPEDIDVVGPRPQRNRMPLKAAYAQLHSRRLAGTIGLSLAKLPIRSKTLKVGDHAYGDGRQSKRSQQWGGSASDDVMQPSIHSITTYRDLVGYARVRHLREGFRGSDQSVGTLAPEASPSLPIPSLGPSRASRELVPIAVELRRRSWVNYLTRGKRRPPAPVSGKR